MVPKWTGVDTGAVHAGQRAADATGSNPDLPVAPLVLNSAVLIDDVEQGWRQLTREEDDNFAYRRYANPTVRVLERKWAAMENAFDALAFASGMTACYAIFRTFLAAGDHVVTQHSLYHEISDQLKMDEASAGIQTTLLEDYSIHSFESAFTGTTSAL